MRFYLGRSHGHGQSNIILASMVEIRFIMIFKNVFVLCEITEHRLKKVSGLYRIIAKGGFPHIKHSNVG